MNKLSFLFNAKKEDAHKVRNWIRKQLGKKNLNNLVDIELDVDYHTTGQPRYTVPCGDSLTFDQYNEILDMVYASHQFGNMNHMGGRGIKYIRTYRDTRDARDAMFFHKEDKSKDVYNLTFDGWEQVIFHVDLSGNAEMSMFEAIKTYLADKNDHHKNHNYWTKEPNEDTVAEDLRTNSFVTVDNNTFNVHEFPELSLRDQALRHILLTESVDGRVVERFAFDEREQVASVLYEGDSSIYQYPFKGYFTKTVNK